MRIPTRRLTAFASIAAGSLYLGFFAIDTHAYGSLLAATAYGFTLAAFSLFVFSFFSALRTANRPKLQKRSTWTAPICCLALAALMFAREGPSFKVTMDEPILANVAISMHEHRDASVREYSLSSGLGSETVVDKRPFLFPFLVSVIHDLFGVQPMAPFYLNLGLTAALLLLVYKTINQSGKKTGGAILATAAIATHPLFIQNASGGGFEILNSLLIVALCVFATQFYRNPSSHSLNLLVFTSILLAYTRYESALFVPATGALVVIQYIKAKQVTLSKLSLFAPLLMLPVAWQNRYINSTPQFWELKDSDMSPFGLGYLENNLASAYKFLFAPGPDLASSPLFSIAIAISAAYLAGTAFTLSKKRIHTLNAAFWPALVITATVASNFALLMLYWWGTLSDVAASRLAIPSLTLGALALGFAQNHLAARRPYLRWIAPAIIALSALYSFPVSSRAEYSKLSLQSRQFEWLLHQSGGEIGQSDLVISQLSRIWSTRQIPAISLKRALLNWEAVKLHQELKTYRNIFVVQQLHTTFKDGNISQKLNSGNDLGPAFQLETLNEVSLYPYNLTRISRVTRIDPAAIDELGGLDEYLKRFASEAYQAHYEVSAEERGLWQKSLP